LAFLLVSGGIFYLNSVYSNIFLLDFSQKQEISEPKPQTKDLLKTENKGVDSSKILQANNIQPDSVLQKDSSKISEIPPKDSVVREQVALKEEKPIVQNKPVITPDTSQTKVEEPVIETNYYDQTDSNYVKWTKKTAGMFEAMDPKKAAKIIERYSDNIARDIIYGMKKKKAAEILAELNPDTASRIARMP